jgi:carbon storage regulator
VLVITRKLNEAVMIGDGVEVRILRVAGGGVKLGITAPASVPIHRQEVYDQIREENRAAARAQLPADGLATQLRAYVMARTTSPEPEAAS